MDTTNLAMQPFTLAFKSPEVEGEFLGEVAKKRWPVLMFIFCFDVLCFLFRFTAKLSSTTGPDAVHPVEVFQEMGHQLANMAMLYVLIGLLNKRARKAGDNAARQEEVLLSICMGLAICNLLASLRTDNAQDYVYLSFFLICTSTFLKIRWWVGTGLLATPTLAVSLWYSSPAPSALLPKDAVVHIIVAWAVGGLMAYLSDWTRRQMYANARVAHDAHEKEMKEARARIQAQRELAAAQAQAAQRALTVAREKAAHEAKSEFMSLMCHEVRTPLNGCLASAEMLLETPLKEEQRELANTIRVSGSILLSTVSNFLDFFKLEAGKRLDIVRSEVVLTDLVSDVHCIIEAMIGRGGAVNLHLPQLLGVPEVVCCDPDRLRGVLLNLYTNAAKFTKRGHIVLRVRCVSREWTPPAPAGYSAIMLQPSYLPSSSADRSMDMSARIILPAQQGTFNNNSSSTDSSPAGTDGEASVVETPAAAGSTYQQQQQQAAASSEALPALQQQQQQQQQQPRQQPHSQPLPNGQRHQQQLPFWQQASQWACSFLPLQEQELDLTVSLRQRHLTRASSSSSSLASLEVSADSQTGKLLPTKDDALQDSSSQQRESGTTAGTSGKGGHQFDVHATSSSQAAAQHRRHQQHPQGKDQAALAAAAAASALGPAPRNRRNSLASADDACWLLFEVEDTGVGITRDGLATLFREYVQGTEDEMCKPRTRGGTGLGLSICSKQVGVLGGVIGAYSCRGHGSNFWFKIPVRAVKPGRTSSNASSGSMAAAVAAAVKQSGAQPVQQQQQQRTVLTPSQAQQQPQQQHGAAGSADGAGQRHSPLGTVIAKQGDYTKSSLYQLTNSSSSIHTGSKAGRPQDSGSGSSSRADNSSSLQPQHVQQDGLAEGAAAASSGPLQRAMAAAAAAAGTPAAPGTAAAAAVAAGGGPSPSHQLPPPAPGPPTGSAGAAAAAAAAASAASSSQTGPRVRQLSLDGKQPGPALDMSLLVGRRVLLAEDNLINQTVARKMLSSIGMLVEVASNGVEAVAAVQRTRTAPNADSDSSQPQQQQQAIQGSGPGQTAPAAAKASSSGGSSQQPFTIILMDMAMPTMGGVEATRILREEGFTLPIVAMTANASDKDRDECAAAGMNGFLSKPVLRDQLARAMMAAVEAAEGSSAGVAAADDLQGC